MKTHDEMIATWKQDPTFQQEYNALEEEFALFDAQVSAALDRYELRTIEVG